MVSLADQFLYKLKVDQDFMILLCELEIVLLNKIVM